MADLPILPKKGESLPPPTPSSDLSDDWETVTVPDTEPDTSKTVGPIGKSQTPTENDAMSFKLSKHTGKGKFTESINYLNRQPSSDDDRPKSESPPPGTELLAVQSSSKIDASVPLTNLLLGLGFSGRENESTLPPTLLAALRNRLSTSYLTTSLNAARSSPHPLSSLPHFVFGAFIFPTVVSAVIHDKNLSREQIARCMTPATLKGYKKCGVKHATFPAAFPTSEAGAEIQGVVIFGMDTPERRERMERFQGGMYDLQRAVAEMVSSEGEVVKHEVVVYVWNGPSGALIIPGEGEETKWSASRMMRGGWLRGILERNGEVVKDLDAGETVSEEEGKGKLKSVTKKMGGC